MKVVKILFKVIIIITFFIGVLFGAKKLILFGEEKKMDYINSTYISLSDEQLDIIDNNLSLYKTMTDASLSTVFNEEDYKIAGDKFALSAFCDATKYLKEDLNHSHIKSFKHYWSYVTFKIDRDDLSDAIYSPKYNHLSTVKVTMTYPDFDYIINYKLFEYCAENNLEDVDVSLDSTFVKDFFAENYKENLLTTTLSIPVILIDDETIKFFTNWIDDTDYFLSLKQYNYTNLSFKSAKLDDKLKKEKTLIDNFNNGQIDNVIEEIIKQDVIGDSIVEQLEEIKSLETGAKTALIKALLSSWKIDYTVIKLKADVDSDKYEKMLLVSIPTVEYINQFVFYNRSINLYSDDLEYLYADIANTLIMIYEENIEEIN